MATASYGGVASGPNQNYTPAPNYSPAPPQYSPTSGPGTQVGPYVFTPQGTWNPADRGGGSSGGGGGGGGSTPSTTLAESGMLSTEEKVAIAKSSGKTGLTPSEIKYYEQRKQESFGVIPVSSRFSAAQQGAYASQSGGQMPVNDWWSMSPEASRKVNFVFQAPVEKLPPGATSAGFTASRQALAEGTFTPGEKSQVLNPNMGWGVSQLFYSGQPLQKEVKPAVVTSATNEPVKTSLWGKLSGAYANMPKFGAANAMPTKQPTYANATWSDIQATNITRINATKLSDKFKQQLGLAPIGTKQVGGETFKVYKYPIFKERAGIWIGGNIKLTPSEKRNVTISAAVQGAGYGALVGGLFGAALVKSPAMPRTGYSGAKSFITTKTTTYEGGMPKVTESRILTQIKDRVFAGAVKTETISPARGAMPEMQKGFFGFGEVKGGKVSKPVTGRMFSFSRDITRLPSGESTGVSLGYFQPQKGMVTKAAAYYRAVPGVKIVTPEYTYQEFGKLGLSFRPKGASSGIVAKERIVQYPRNIKDLFGGSEGGTLKPRPLETKAIPTTQASKPRPLETKAIPTTQASMSDMASAKLFEARAVKRVYNAQRYQAVKGYQTEAAQSQILKNVLGISAATGARAATSTRLNNAQLQRQSPMEFQTLRLPQKQVNVQRNTQIQRQFQQIFQGQTQRQPTIERQITRTTTTTPTTPTPLTPIEPPPFLMPGAMPKFVDIESRRKFQAPKIKQKYTPSLRAIFLHETAKGKAPKGFLTGLENRPIYGK